MELQQNETESIIEPLKKVNSLSKYLALGLFIILPFLGAYVGYTIAPKKVVMTESVLLQKDNSNDATKVTNEVGSESDTLLTDYIADPRYKTDGKNVYLFDDLEPRDDDDTIRRYNLAGADPATFEPSIVKTFPISQGNTFQAWISRDKNNVYYQDKKIEGADSASFVIDDEVPITKDKDDVFLYYKKIPLADPKTYEVLFNTGTGARGKVFGKDANNCYLEYEIMSCADVPTTIEEAFNFQDNSQI
ncbi:MAG: hypothetical protein RLZZ76_553 [Candidatus Parcubacteria bacterium]|jgi:hypothetical protein